MTYLTYSPIDEIERLEHGLRNVLDHFPATWEWKNNAVPAIDVYEDSTNLYTDMELPGLSKDDVKITIHNGVLTIKGERRDARENNRRYLHTERTNGTFSRSFTLPVEVDVNKVDANFTNGILHITMPKSNPRDIERTIEIR